VNQPPSSPRDSHLPGPGESWTPIRLTRWSGNYLKEKGVENGRLESELLFAKVLGVARLDLYLQFDRPIKPAELKAFKALLLRRAGREPLQYILGTTAFRELELRTDPRALIPRPETEVLVGEVLSRVSEKGSELTGLDVGTGSGAIALSLLKEGSFKKMVATDVSPAALELARENAEALGFGEFLDLRQGMLLDPVEAGECFDVLVSNPPYVPGSEEGSLQTEVRDWEPKDALFAGPEGLDVILPLVQVAPGSLRPGGLFATEIGEGQGARVAQVLEETGRFSEVSVLPDLAGRDRIVLGVASV